MVLWFRFGNLPEDIQLASWVWICIRLPGSLNTPWCFPNFIYLCSNSAENHSVKFPRHKHNKWTKKSPWFQVTLNMKEYRSGWIKLFTPLNIQFSITSHLYLRLSLTLSMKFHYFFSTGPSSFWLLFGIVSVSLLALSHKPSCRRFSHNRLVDGRGKWVKEQTWVPLLPLLPTSPLQEWKAWPVCPCAFSI